MDLFCQKLANHFWVKINFLLINKAGDTRSDNTVAKEDVTKTDKNEDTVKERPSRKSRKKEKEPAEKPSIKSRLEKKLLVLPLEASVLAIFLLVLLGAFYVVYNLLFFYLLHASTTAVAFYFLRTKLKL